MSMTDPIADLLTRIRNGQTAGKSEVQLGASRLKAAIVKVLKEEGYISDFRLDADGGKPRLTIGLKYFEGRPVIDRLERVSGADREEARDQVLRSRAGAHARRRHARPSREHGARRHQGLREEARAGGRRFSRAGAGQEPESDAGFLAPRERGDPGGH